VTSKFSGDLEDIRVAPIPHSYIVWAMGIGGVFRGGLVAVVTGIVGYVFQYFQLHLSFSVLHAGWLIFFFVVGGLIFAFLGIFVAVLANTFDQLSAFSSFVLLPLTYLGGVFISIETLHPVWQSISRLNPLFYLINGFRFSMIGQSDVAVLTSASVAIIGVVITYFMARFALKKGSFSRW
jgi:ABC-2 type transport system permease protein